MGKVVNTFFFSENLKGRDHSGDPDLDKKIMLGRILETWRRKMWTGFMWLKIGTSGGLLTR
jgi:hypothetical protein